MFFSRDKIIDLDEVIDFSNAPDLYKRSDVSLEGEDPRAFRKINHVLYGIAPKELGSDDKKIMSECLIAIEEKFKVIENLQLKIIERAMNKVIDNLREKTNSGRIRDLLEHNPSVLFVKVVDLITTYYEIIARNKTYRKNYGNDAKKWLTEEITSWAKKDNLTSSEINEILSWGRENRDFFYNLPFTRINIAFSRYRAYDGTFEELIQPIREKTNPSIL